MATRFLRYDSDPILRKKCKAVLKVDDKIRQLLDDMLDTLHETENGAALAANQVGVLKRLVVIDFNDTRLKLVNPKMINQSGVQECVEGCLSFPNRFVKTIRPQKVTIQALNEYPERCSPPGGLPLGRKWQRSQSAPLRCPDCWCRNNSCPPCRCRCPSPRRR